MMGQWEANSVEHNRHIEWRYPFLTQSRTMQLKYDNGNKEPKKWRMSTLLMILASDEIDCWIHLLVKSCRKLWVCLVSKNRTWLVETWRNKARGGREDMGVVQSFKKKSIWRVSLMQLMQSELFKCLKGKSMMHSNHIFKTTKWIKHLPLHLQTEHASLSLKILPLEVRLNSFQEDLFKDMQCDFSENWFRKKYSVLKQAKTFPMYLDAWTLQH